MIATETVYSLPPSCQEWLTSNSVTSRALKLANCHMESHKWCTECWPWKKSENHNFGI